MSTAVRVTYQVQRVTPGQPTELVDTCLDEEEAWAALTLYSLENPDQALRIVRYAVHVSEVSNDPHGR
jgi:hypothetical protein